MNLSFPPSGQIKAALRRIQELEHRKDGSQSLRLPNKLQFPSAFVVRDLGLGRKQRNAQRVEERAHLVVGR